MTRVNPCVSISLSLAASSGDIEGIEDCINKGADVRMWSNEALRLAACNEHKHICRKLVVHGASFEDAIEGCKYSMWWVEDISKIKKMRDEIESEKILEGL